MALIPPDAGILMRMQNEASNLLQGLQPVRGLPADLPQLQPGQVFRAYLQEVLPDNTFKALVAGRQLTLQLPESAKAGDELELLVVDRSGRTIIARQADAANKGGGEAYPFARFSLAGRVIARLLPAQGEAPPPAQLNRGQPLAPAPPQPTSNSAPPPTANSQPPAANTPQTVASSTGAAQQTTASAAQQTAASAAQQTTASAAPVTVAASQLAAALAKAVAASGLFYESHQKQWINGKISLEKLLQEPQARLSQWLNGKLGDGRGSVGVRMMTPPATSSPTSLQGPQQAATANGGGGEQQVVAGRNLPPLAAVAAATRGLAEKTEAAASSNDGKAGAEAARSSTQSLAANLAKIPEELRPLVQQQLEALATQRLNWHGEVWPRQQIEWSIERDDAREGEGDGDDDEQGRWRTALALTMPHLGRVDATLHLATAGVRITLAVADDEAAARLRAAAPQLQAALDAAGAPLLALQVQRRRDEEAAAKTP